MKSAYTGLWLLLATALAVFLLIEVSPDLDVAGWTPKKSRFTAFLTSEEASGPLQFGETVPDTLDILKEEVHKTETDTLPKSVLLFGDSMTFNLALRLACYAAQNGHSFHAVNWDSSNTKIWAESDTLQHYLKLYNVDFAFITLGSNEVYFKNPEVRLPYVKKILKKLEGIPYVWIGPPNWNKDTGINDMLAGVCAPGTFFRSEGMEFKRKADHIHPTRQSSALWMDSIMRWLPSSAHPILNEIPSDSLGKVKTNVIFLKALNK